MNNMENKDHEYQYPEREYFSVPQKKDSGNGGVIWGSIVIAVVLLASSITYVAGASRYPALASQTAQNSAQNQETYAAPVNNSVAPSCGVQ